MSASPELPDEALAVIAVFCRLNARLGTREGAFDRCRPTSLALLDALSAAGVDAVGIRMSGYREWVPDAHPKWLALGKSSYWTHYAVRIGELLVDATSRQFDPKSPFPALVPMTEVRNAWEDVDDWDLALGEALRGASPGP